MDIEFDPAKDAANIAKHGVPLAFGAVIFEDVGHLVISAARDVDGEARSKVIGMVGDRLWTAVFINRGDARRMISVRKSNATEARIYHTP